MLQPVAVKEQHTKMNPTSIGEASLIGSGLKGVGDRSWRDVLQKSGTVEFGQNIQGTNPPSKSYEFPKGGEVTLTQAAGKFKLTWEGNVSGKTEKIEIQFSKGSAPTLTPAMEAARMP